MSKRIMIFSAMAMMIATVLVSCSGKSEKEGKLEVNKGLAARVGNSKITLKEIEEKFQTMTSNIKSQYIGESGRAKFVDVMIDEELLYLAAGKTDLKYDEEVKDRIRRAERTILITAFLEKKVRDKVEVTDAEIEKYYNDNWEEFMNRAIMKAQHILSEDSMKVVEWKRRLDAGEKFSVIAKNESEDRTTSINSGNLGYFNPGGYIKFYGESDEFTRQVKDLEIGEVSDIIITKKGFSIVKVNDKKPENPKPLSEVREDIFDQLRDAKAKDYLDLEISRLREEYKPVNYVRGEIIRTTRTPEELWAIAQEEGDKNARVEYYRELVDRYPDHKFAPQALFMIGFVFSEEIGDLVRARKTFVELLEKYPDSEVAESAKWMVKNINKAHPKFESADDMKEHIEEKLDGQE